MSEPRSEQREPDEVAQGVTSAGSTDESGGNLTLEDDPQGTSDPADLAGSGGSGDDGVE